MIVIATHDDTKFLRLSIKNMKNADLNGHQVIFIDTNSNNKDFLEDFSLMEKKHPEFIFKRLDYTCWDSGAYIHSYLNYKSEKYIFLQDSIEIINPNYIVELDNLLSLYDVVPHFSFEYRYDDEEQKNWSEEGIDFTSLPELGIFGPLFAVNKSILDIIPDKWLKYPTSKNFGCGMERRWALMFKCINAYIGYLEKDVYLDSSLYIKKYSPCRI